MTYQSVSAFAQTWGLIFLIIMFAVAVAYALWPRNKQKFERAAHLPLMDAGIPDEAATPRREEKSIPPREKNEVDRG